MNRLTSFSARFLSLGQKLRERRSRLLWMSVGAVGLTMALIACATHTIMAPPGIPGATFVGTKSCADCHEEITRDFPTATHSRLKAFLR